MLVIAQAGQAGKTKYLFEMHRFRKRVFKERLNWDVNVTQGGLEVDQFDTPEAVYLLAIDDNQRVIGNWRLLPTTGPIMIRDVWPGFLQSIDIPRDKFVWEASRFAVEGPQDQTDEGLALVHRATQELFCGLTELCLLCGIKEIVTMYDMRIARLLKRLDCSPVSISEKLTVAGAQAQVGLFNTNMAMLNRLRAASGIRQPLVTKSMIPPVMDLLRPSQIDLRERRA